ncbi:hypothetical protein N9M66_03485 [Litoreibacter sp.]|nr:hypothetical protein [Litoreibacter sp.]
MADVNKDRFNERLDALKQKTNPAKRVEKRVQEDGLVVDVVKTDLKKRGLVPIKSLLIAGFLFVAFKGFILAELGEAEYLGRIEALKTGGAVEVTTAFLLDMDPATQAIAKVVGSILR